MLTARVLLLSLLSQFALFHVAHAQKDRPAAGNLVRVTILHVNDVSRFTPVERGDRGGLARVSTLRKRFTQESPNTLLVLAGNTLSPSAESVREQGRQMIEAWNAAGLDLAVFGNHDFDFGAQVLRQHVSDSRFRWLGANIRNKYGQQRFDPVKRLLRQCEDDADYVVCTFDNVRVGIFGLVSPDARWTSSPGDEIEFQEPAQAAARVVKKLRGAGAQVIVALTNMSLERDQELARLVPEINVIIGGNARNITQSLAVRTPILKMSSDARDMGVVNLNIHSSSGKLESIDTQVVPVTSVIPEDPQVSFAVKNYGLLLDELAKPVGRTTVALDARAESNDTGETNLGSFIADTFRQQLKADAVIINSGVISGDTIIPPGLLRLRDILSLLPFRHTLVTLNVPGSVIRQALEHGVSGDDRSNWSGRFPQVSGLRFAFDPTRPSGSRIVSLTVNNKPLVGGKLYKLVTTSALREGGYNYNMFRREAESSAFGQVNPTTLLNTSFAHAGNAKDFRMLSLNLGPVQRPIDSEILLKHLNMASPIAPRTDGRIQRTTSNPSTAP